MTPSGDHKHCCEPSECILGRSIFWLRAPRGREHTPLPNPPLRSHGPSASPPRWWNPDSHQHVKRDLLRTQMSKQCYHQLHIWITCNYSYTCMHEYRHVYWLHGHKTSQTTMRPSFRSTMRPSKLFSALLLSGCLPSFVFLAVKLPPQIITADLHSHWSSCSQNSSLKYMYNVYVWVVYYSYVYMYIQTTVKTAHFKVDFDETCSAKWISFRFLLA